jgi:hypothetical protein
MEVEQQNATEEPVHQQDQVSTTDPDATAAQDMLTRFTQWQGREPESVAADTDLENEPTGQTADGVSEVW